MTSSRDLVCACMAHESAELFTRWMARAEVVTGRMLARGRAVDQDRVCAVLRLIRGIDSGRADSFSEANWGRSHHLPDCQFSGHRNPSAAVRHEGLSWNP